MMISRQAARIAASSLVLLVTTACAGYAGGSPDDCPPPSLSQKREIAADGTEQMLSAKEGVVSYVKSQARAGRWKTSDARLVLRRLNKFVSVVKDFRAGAPAGTRKFFHHEQLLLGRLWQRVIGAGFHAVTWSLRHRRHAYSGSLERTRQQARYQFRLRLNPGSKLAQAFSYMNTHLTPGCA